MAKPRKTRAQKIAASLRHPQLTQQLTYSLKNIPLSNPKFPQSKITTHEYATAHSYAYAYTNSDLQKTFLISAILISIELILFFVLHQHLVKIPWAVY